LLVASRPNFQRAYLYATESGIEEQHSNSLIGTQQFNPVTKGIVDVAAANAGNIVHLLTSDAITGEIPDQ
jgi:hypothetical protein